MASEMKMAVAVDIVDLRCHAMDCRHNGIHRGAGKCIGRCDYKHIYIGRSGECKSYAPVAGKATDAGL